MSLFRRRKERVQYGDKTGKMAARPFIDADTLEQKLAIRGEKYALRGAPRNHVLHGPMAELKRRMKNVVIEQLAAHIKKTIPYKIPEKNWAIPVQEMARVFDLMIEAEDEPSMKQLIKQLRDPICMILQEDDAWRFRAQWFLENLNMKKVRLNKSDKYYFRAKSFKEEAIG